jgi:putative phosphoesterase
MKVMIASDIHGSKYYAGEMLKIFHEEKADKLVLLGDLYSSSFKYFDEEDDNIKISLPEMLSTVRDRLLVIKGNCDSSIDEMLSPFPMLDIATMEVGYNKVCFTHGHKYNITNVPPNFGDILIYGHLHQGFIIKEDGRIFANPGSIACPRNGSEHSYLILTEGEIILKNLAGEIIDSRKA